MVGVRFGGFPWYDARTVGCGGCWMSRTGRGVRGEREERNLLAGCAGWEVVTGLR